MASLTCSRCGAGFSLREDHTEIVRRDFLGEPQPSAVEHLCADCMRSYREEFIGSEGIGAEAPSPEQDVES